ncbi:pyruvate kinase, partial [Haematococcus lacustris]
MSTREAVLGCAAKDVLDVGAGMIIVVTTKGDAARLVSKYRPRVPVLVVTNNERVARQCSPCSALYPYLVDTLPYTRDDIEFELMLEKATIYGCEQGLCQPGQEVVVVHGCVEADAESMPM